MHRAQGMDEQVAAFGELVMRGGAPGLAAALEARFHSMGDALTAPQVADVLQPLDTRKLAQTFQKMVVKERWTPESLYRLAATAWTLAFIADLQPEEE